MGPLPEHDRLGGTISLQGRPFGNFADEAVAQPTMTCTLQPSGPSVGGAELIGLCVVGGTVGYIVGSGMFHIQNVVR